MLEEKKIWKPKTKLIQNYLNKFNASNFHIVDIGGGYGVFAEEFLQLSNKSPTIIEPAPHLAEICREKGFIVIENFLENISIEELPDVPKCFVSFELFEHLYSPVKFLEILNKLMKKNDLFIFTTLSGIGLDIQVLWEKSPSVSPPHHLNFLNPLSLKILLKRQGFKNIEITTPGKLDIDILFNNKKFIKDRFWSTFLKVATKEQKKIFQSVLQESSLSSHMMIACQK